MQNHAVDQLLAELRALITDLGRDGGLIGASVYDTAQVIRLAPPTSGVQHTLAWLVQQQQPDGGWGNPAFPRARDVPTLSALQGLHLYATTPQDRRHIQAGLAFLRQHAPIWEAQLPDDLPVGIELLLPRLLEQAHAAGLRVPGTPYAALIALGERRRSILAALPARAGTPPAHVWEGWGWDPAPELVDASGGVGHSPAATAAWLRASSRRGDLATAREAAHRYLEQAAAATGVGIPGVVPTVWPIPRFEQPFALYMLLAGGLLDHPLLQEAVGLQLGDLARALGASGLGMSDHFLPDGDDTAAALALLLASGRAAQPSILERFAHADHFCAYAGELQPSLSVTAHAVHTLRLAGQPCAPAVRYLLDHQFSDGRWLGDKWNSSWLYTTSQAIIALADSLHIDALRRAADALVGYQHADGGWGDGQSATIEGTAYGVLALRVLTRHGLGTRVDQSALELAERWLLRNYHPFEHRDYEACWLGKQSYLPRRIVRIIQLAATFPTAELPAVLPISQAVGQARPTQSAEQITVALAPS
jgi:hypothetical protein